MGLGNTGIDLVIMDLGVRLTETAVKHTWSKVSDSLRQIKSKKDKNS